MPRCDSKDPDFELAKSPYCLPFDYNKDIVPPTYGDPLHINVDIWVFEVSRIDDMALAMTFELYFDLTWKETRLIINDRKEREESLVFKSSTTKLYLAGCGWTQS
jgi:hypothetical protein